MKVSRLMELLSKCNPEAVVFLATDCEGNSYRKAYDIWDEDCAFKGNNIGFPKLTPELESAGYTEDDVIKGGKPAVVLYPSD